MANSLSQRIKLATQILLKGAPQSSTPTLDIPLITPQEVAEAKAFFPRPKFFIYGHARSGTTLLTRLIRLHPQVHCNYQAHFFTRAPLLQALVQDAEVRSWLSRRSNRWNHGGDLSALVLRCVADFIMERDAAQVNKSIVGDKSPNSLLDGEAVRLLHNIYPDAHLIFIVRDGRDAAISHRFQQFIDASQHLSQTDIRLSQEFIANPQPFMSGERSIFTEKNIRQAAEGWVRNVCETDAQGRQIFAEQYISLRYEDLLKEPATNIKRLWAFLGADVRDPALDEIVAAEMQQNPDADWQRQKAGDLVSPLEKGKKGSWKTMFTARDRDLFKSIAGQTLVDWNYETSFDW